MADSKRQAHSFELGELTEEDHELIETMFGYDDQRYAEAVLSYLNLPQNDRRIFWSPQLAQRTLKTLDRDIIDPLVAANTADRSVLSEARLLGSIGSPEARRTVDHARRTTPPDQPFGFTEVKEAVRRVIRERDLRIAAYRRERRGLKEHLGAMRFAQRQEAGARTKAYVDLAKEVMSEESNELRIGRRTRQALRARYRELLQEHQSQGAS